MMGRFVSGLVASFFALTLAVGDTALAASPATPAPTTTTDPTRGGVYVTTLPGGGDVFFDGTYVGRAPLVVDGVAAGRHALTVTKAGFATVETTVSVAAGAMSMASTRLAAAARGANAEESGALAVRGLPPHASVRVDGVPVASPKDPLALEPGPHRLDVTNKEGRTTRTFTVFAGTTTDVVLGEVPAQAHRNAVVALAEDYLPTNAFTVDGARIVVHYLGHTVVAHFGDPHIRMDGTVLAFDSAPESIGGKLYLPLELLEKVTGDVSKSR